MLGILSERLDDMNLLDALKYHAKKYSKMQPADAVKLVYQNEFGGEYIERNLGNGLQKLKQEIKNVVPDESVGLFEPIGNGFMRVNLAAMPANDVSVYTLDSLYVLSTKIYGGSHMSFVEKLNELKRLNKEYSLFSFSQEELEAYINAYIAAGCPTVSHSDEFKQAYAPAYRVVHKELLRLYVFDY